jgi:hypothetical protein
MAHNLGFLNGSVMMAYQGETPWHQLGQRLGGTADVAAAMSAAQTIYSATYRAGVWCAQLSAPGYMDQTDLSVFETRDEAETYLVETYDTDDDDSDDDEPMDDIDNLPEPEGN